MKLNGTDNIITDKDITLTGNKHLGKSLSSVIENNDNRIDSLEQNVKFLYEHGGIGGGAGSGSGTGATKWKLRATLGNNECVSGGTIGLINGTGTYNLRIWTTNGSGVYSVTYSYGNKGDTTITLNSGNTWSTNIRLDLVSNGVLSITATDGSISRQISGVSYIVEPFKFNAPRIESNSGSVYQSEVFVEDAIQTGVILKSPNYAYAVEGEYHYEWYYDNVLIDQGDITESSGDLTCDITQYMSNENAATHFYKLIVYARTGTDLEPVKIEYVGNFNLIPTSLFLKLTPSEGEIFYDSSTIDDPYVFGINRVISIQARIYKGKNATNDTGTLTWTTYENGDVVSTNSIAVRDGKSYNTNVSFGTIGWNYVVFTYSLAGESGAPITKYLYCDASETEYNWYVDGHVPNSRRHYVAQETINDGVLSKISGISWAGLNINNPPLYIEKLSSDLNPTELTIENFATGEQMINIGIQYSKVNNVKDVLIKLYDSEDKSKDTICIYQDKVTFGSDIFESENQCKIFLHKERSYNINDRSKYHLLTICMSHTGSLDSNNNPYFEIAVYFDGVLEGAVSTKAIATRRIYKVDLMPANYAINQFEISSWPVVTGTRLLNDNDVNWYWNSYKARTDRNSSLTTEDTLILTSLFDPNNNNAPTYNLENELIRVPDGFAETVANNVEVPVLVLSCPREIQWGENQISSIFEWINTKFTDGQGGLLTVDVDTELYYSPGKAPLNRIIIPETLGSNNKFTIKIQGTSTVSNKAKNFTLRLVSGSDITDAGEAILFTPNYDKDDTSTFLPEQAFTLKADVVDSSHTNNTAMGKFINENNRWNYGGNFVGDSQILDHVKQCLEGFATLVFLNVTYRENDIDYSSYYYLGIYNFNLGRDSYFNLGYCDLSQISITTLEEQSNSYFKFCKVGGANSRGVNPVSGFIAAEVQDNSEYWDFSQYDNTILFPINRIETSNFMFGDIVNAAGEDNIVQNRIQNFVKSVSAAGGYIFERIGKTLADCASQNGSVGRYNVIDTVSDYKIQHRRTYDGSTPVFTPYTGDLINVSEGSLRNCIVDDPDNEIYSKLNYDSVVYYYTTCMAFGLVDSVQKNLNIKTWTATNADRCQMGLYFYDMDTCLGKDNSGGDVSYFAFSDFWKSNIDRYDSAGNLIDPSDNLTEVARVVNNGCDIYRDCFIPGGVVTGYDIPSSYLFAIAKYSKAVMSEFDSTRFPQQIYAEWRSIGGPLQNADTFIDKYFVSNFDGIPECLINLNYRNKYLYDYNGSGQTLEKASVLKGRSIEYTREWLSGRLRILDAYFNLGQSDIEITTGISEPKHQAQVMNNPDVFILNDIFTDTPNGKIQRNQSFSFVVSAEDYTPLFVTLGTTYRWYMFEDSNIQYETHIPITGTLVTSFGGSQQWRTLNTINGFIDTMNHPEDNFIFNSETIDSISGTSGTHTGNWLITGPSLKSIVLTSPNYSGTLNITNQFPSLSTINISNSSISLTVNEVGITNGGITTINASNLKNSAQLSIENCNKLTTCNLNRSNINTCVISPTWTDSLNFSTVYAKNLRLTAKNSGNLTINGNSIVSDIQFSKMRTVYINNCSQLTSIRCTDTNIKSLVSLTVTNCRSLRTLEIVADNNLEVINLYNCSNLETIKITGSVTSFPNLRILDFGRTKITTINLVLNGTTSSMTDGIFDFTTLFPNVGTGGNKSTSYIRFDETPVKTLQFKNTDPTHPIYLWYTFYNSTIERLYGTFRIEDVPNIFARCSNFSVHGTDLSIAEWAGSKVISSGRIRHPSELTNNAETYNRTGPDVTNLEFDTNFTSTGSSLDSGAFCYTSCTVFDVYYILYRVKPQLKSLSHAFYGTTGTYSKFSWNATADNSPHRLTFAKCVGVTSLYRTFTGSGLIRLISPSHNTDDVITQDNGLFSPMPDLTSITQSFYGYTTVLDRFLFRRTSGDYSIQTWSYFHMTRIVDDANTISYANARTFSTYVNYINSNGWNITEKFGNLTGFFINLSNLKELYAFATSNGSNTEYLNFSTISGIPDGVTKIIQSFRSSYGTGEINLSNYFGVNTQLTMLGHSFVTTSAYNGDAPYMTLTNNTFERFVPRSGYSGIIHIANTGQEGHNSYTIADKRDNCFSGAIRKYINNTFPFDILKNLTNLERAEGIFQNAEGSIVNLKLPGNVFEYNTKLTSCRACFYNIKIPYTISETHDITYESVNANTGRAVITESDQTSSNFINCPNIQNVAYLFGAEVGSGIDTDMPRLSGQIPKNLFWHGATVTPTYFTGANERTQNVDENNNPIANSYTYTQLTDSILKIEPFVTINDMSNCFQHCNTSAYENLNPSVEDNPNYNPFVYNYNSSQNKYVQNTTRNINKRTLIWQFDGINKPSSNLDNVEQLDTINWSEQMTEGGVQKNRFSINAATWLAGNDVLPQPTQNYIAPPDLLRFCTSTCNIDGLFAYSGLSNMNSANTTGNSQNKYLYGVRGRICPYMLLPVKNTGSVYQIFIACKCISYIHDDLEQKDWWIPEKFFEYGNKVTDLRLAFSRTIQPHKSDLEHVFDKLGNKNNILTSPELKIDQIFEYTYWSGVSSEDKTILRNAFIYNKISSLTGCFRVRANVNETEYAPSAQYVTFDNMFPTGGLSYNIPTYDSAAAFSYAFYGYTTGYVTFTTKTLCDSMNNQNYRTTSYVSL